VDRVRDREGCTGAELLENVGLLNERLIAGHCIFVTDDDIARIVKAGAHVCHIPKCNAASGRMAPTPKLRKAGANLTLASDTQHGDMIEVARWALATARMQLGRVDDQWQPRDVLAMATTNGARALGLGDSIGSLKVGKSADLVVWDFRRPHLVPNINPLGNLVHTAQGRDVAKVFVAGDLVVDDGRTTKVDMDRIVANAERAAQSLWKRVTH
jgi:5-methylthioadenosine/S-adenosylhomocysteine deaminase